MIDLKFVIQTLSVCLPLIYANIGQCSQIGRQCEIKDKAAIVLGLQCKLNGNIIAALIFIPYTVVLFEDIPAYCTMDGHNRTRVCVTTILGKSEQIVTPIPQYHFDNNQYFQQLANVSQHRLPMAKGKGRN